MFLHVTTQIDGRKHDGLLAEKGRQAYPSFYIMDGDGNVVAQHQGQRTVALFKQTMTKAAAFIELRKKAAGGDRGAGIEYTIARARMGQLKRADFEAAMAKFGKLGTDEEKAYKGVLAGLMMDELQRTALGEKYAEMLAKGLIPSDERKLGSFYYSIWNYADFKQDVQLMEQSLSGLKKAWGDNPRYAPHVARFEKKLAAAKSKSGSG